ncbi:MAG: hypothetical protein LBO74_18030 [Candidatus Symbiothrix sp.]|jgi:hypothetical protein|nr:hypothetical protein [Candidatus Symbiothrix sp.]
MQYQSIIRLLEYCNIDSNTMDAGKIRKILSAEFAIAENGIISVDGFDYTKNDIFRELERDDFARRLEYHQLIWKNKSLLECLEKNTVDFKEVSTWFDLRWMKGFSNFISPYYAESFDKVMRKFLHPVDFGEANRWFRMFIFIDNAEDEDKALSGIRIFVSDFIRMVRNANDVTYVDIIPELEDWINQPGASFLNSFPASLYKLKDDLVSALINLIVIIQHTNKNLSYEISGLLYELTGLNQETQELIQKNHKIVEANAVGPSKGGKGGCSISGIGIGTLIYMILIILRINTCSHHSSTPNFDFSQYSIPYEEKKITADFFEDLRTTYSLVDTTQFGEFDQEMVINRNITYYMTFERSDKAKSITIHIINNGTMPVTFYLKDAEGILFPFMISPDEKIKLSRDKNTLDLLLSNKEEIPSVIKPHPVYIFDTPQYTTHVVELKRKEGILYLDKLEDIPSKDEITMEIYSTLNEQGNAVNYLKFSNARWVSYSQPELGN